MSRLLAVLFLLTILGTDGGKIAPEKEITIKPVGNEMKYETTEIEAKAGTELTIIFENTATSEAMQHNVVVLRQKADIDAVGQAALTAQENGYIPSEYEEDILAFTKMAAPGETEQVTFTVPPPGEYPYICTFPGHYTTMQGTLISVE
jgi:azurin